MNEPAEARSWYRSRSRSVNLKTSMHGCEGIHRIAGFCGHSVAFHRGIPGLLTALRHAFERSVSRRRLQIRPLICPLVVPQLTGDGEMLFRFLGAAETLVRFT